MDGFITWEILKEYASFVGIVFMVVQFTKEMPFIKEIPTKYWSAFISFGLLAITGIYFKDFTYWNLVLYILSSMSISLGSNGLADFNKHKTY